MRRFRISLLPLLSLLAALALASCGESESAELLPGSTASEISSNLSEVRRLAGEGECIGAQDAALEVSDQIDALGGVDAKLKAALREGATRLNEVVAACQEEEPEEEETSPSLSTEPEAVEEPEKAEKKPKPEKSEPPGQEKKTEKEEPAEEPEVEEEPAETTPTEPEAEPPATGGGSPAGGVSPGAPTGGE